MNQAQEFRIKQILAARQDHQGHRLTMASLARLINEPYGSVAGVIYGRKHMPRLREKIAHYLGLTVEELFAPPAAPTAGKIGGGHGG